MARTSVFVVIFFASRSATMKALGPGATFLYHAVLGVVAFVSIKWLPADRSAAHTGAASASPTTPRTGGGSVLVAMTMLAIVLTFMGQSSLWVHIAAAARQVGIGQEALGEVLAIGALLNLLAPVAAERVVPLWGRSGPLVAGYIGLALAIAFVAFGLNPISFLIGAVCLTGFLLYLVPFLLGTLADLDPSGRSASAGPAFLTIGGAIGPSIGGFALGGIGFWLLGVFGVLVVTVALILALIAGSRFSRSAAQPI